MPLVTTKEMFEKSMKEGFAIGAFNINNMEILQGIVDAAEKQKCVLIFMIVYVILEITRNIQNISS